jgi:hypothetical protein
MRPRRLDILLRRVDRRHLRTQARQRLGQQPGPAADIRRALPASGPPVMLVRAEMQVDPLAQIFEPHRVQPVEHRRRPFGSHQSAARRPKCSASSGVDGGGWGSHLNSKPLSLSLSKACPSLHR